MHWVIMLKQTIKLCLIAAAIALTGTVLGVVLQSKRRRTRVDLKRQLEQWEGEGGNPPAHSVGEIRIPSIT